MCGALVVGSPLLQAVGFGIGGALATPSRSTTIALTSDETCLAVVNREANSLSIIQVKDAQGNDVNPAIKLDEIAVGLEPRCVAVHPNGLADGVTWSFGTGSRQTKPLDGMFNKGTNMSDAGILNWSAVRGSNTDFNANSRATQGGWGFASDDFDPGQCFAKGNMTTANPAIYDHGITQGGSEALDAQTLWIFAAVRPLNQPQPSSVGAGRAVFEANCASCHGGAKWTKSEIFHRDNPAAVSQNGAPLDPGVANMLNEFKSFTCNDLTFKYLEDVGTFDVNNPLEIRDNATASTAFGADGFNVPSLLSINYNAPYLHRGQAQTLEEVFTLHGLGAGASGFPPTTTIATELTALELSDLLAFLKSIDGTTEHLPSEGDEFRDALRLQGPCPSPCYA